MSQPAAVYHNKVQAEFKAERESLSRQEVEEQYKSHGDKEIHVAT